MDLNPLDRLPGKAKPTLDVANLPVPEDIHIDKDPQSLRISYSHFKPVIWLALACGAFFIAAGLLLLFTGALGFVYISSLLLGTLFALQLPSRDLQPAHRPGDPRAIESLLWSPAIREESQPGLLGN